MSDVARVRAWFLNHVRDSNNKPYILDDEQARAVLDEHKNTLVSARAGAGKTHTLVAKIIYQIANLGYTPNQILAFVFNRKAATEINERLSKVTVDGLPVVANGANVARTFHSFALNMVKSIDGSWSFGNILLDDDKKADTKSSRQLYIQSIIENLKNKDQFIENAIYDFFRKEYTKIDKDVYETPEDYYESIRNHNFRTLDGKAVSSYSEKIIADFFFEHGVSYKYEPEYYPSYFVKNDLVDRRYAGILTEKDNIKADFYLPDQKIVWEHWAIDGSESSLEIARINESGVIGDYDEYKHNMKWKRFFYSKIWRNDQPAATSMWYGCDFERLVQTNRPLGCDREEFEQKLEQICHEHGIDLSYYPRKELVRRAWKKQVRHFTTMVSSFIDRTQQMYYDNIEQLEAMISSQPEDTEEQIRTKRFQQICIKVYKEYVFRLSQRGVSDLTYVNDNNQEKHFENYGTDFSMILQRSRQLLGEGSADQLLKSRGEARLILVDEYQDFSRLFYENLVGLRQVFPDAKLFCVGDDWQAINRFAGSDDSYFSNFADYFSEDSNKLLISNNYRSAPEIVDNANAVMQQLIGAHHTEFAKPHSSTRGRATIKSIDLGGYEVAVEPGMRYGDTNLRKYVEMIGNLIIQHKYDERILVLHRKKDMLFDISVWGVLRHRVRDYVTSEKRAMIKASFDNKIRFSGDESDVMTVHRSKGLEADTVILLEADPKVFPSEGYNTELFSIFGDSHETTKADEARLFYVAITRPKTNLYVLWGTYRHKPDEIPQYIRTLQVTESKEPQSKQLTQVV